MTDFLQITGSYLFAQFNILIQITKFHIEHSRLNFVEPAVAAGIAEYVFFFGTVIGQGTNHCCQLLVVGGNGSSIAKSPQILSGIKTMTGGITQRTGFAASVEASVSLGIVFYQFKPVMRAEGLNFVAIGTLAVEMNDHQRFAAFGNMFFD